MPENSPAETPLTPDTETGFTPQLKPGGVIPTYGLSTLGEDAGALVLAALEAEAILPSSSGPAENRRTPNSLQEFEPPTTPGGAVLSLLSAA